MQSAAANDSSEERRLVIQPNASLSTYGALAFLGLVCFVTFGLAGALAWLGYWLVLPFAGLEIAALAAALWWSMRDNAYREVISVGEERVAVEVGRHHPQRHWEFQRAWTRVRLEAGKGRHEPTRLWLGSHGKGCILGACLTDEERAAVAGRLAQWL